MLKKWISSWLEDAPQNEQILRQPRLNLKKILVAHDAIKINLEQQLNGLSENELKAQEMEMDCECECDYGKWLYSVGKSQYAETKEYKNALEAHSFFHQIAADIIYMHGEGKTKKAKKILFSSYKEASNLNQIELVRLYNMTIQ